MTTPDNDRERKTASPNNSTEAKTKNAKLAQRKQISRRLMLGWTQAEIAEEMGLSEATVSRECKKLREMHKQQLQSNVADLTAGELEKLAHVEESAWALHSKTNSNDALRTVTAVIKQRAAMLGLENPGLMAVHQRYEEAKELLLQAVLEVVSDPYTLRAIASRIKELEEQRDSNGVPFYSAQVKSEKLSFVPAESETEKPAPLPRRRVKILNSE